MFSNCVAFNGDLSSWDTGKVGTFGGMFDRAAAFNGDISSWDTGKVTRMNSMLSGAVEFRQNLCAWTVNPNPNKGWTYNTFHDTKCPNKNGVTHDNACFE